MIHGKAVCREVRRNKIAERAVAAPGDHCQLLKRVDRERVLEE